MGIGPYAELVKDLDFDFGVGVFQTTYGYFRIEEASELYHVWESNFCTHFKNDVFVTEINLRAA